MESRNFIRAAAQLTIRIKDLQLAEATGIIVSDDSRAEVQKDITQVFVGLQNPTLPSAGKLCDLAWQSGYQVDPKVQHRLQQAESMWT